LLVQRFCSSEKANRFSSSIKMKHTTIYVFSMVRDTVFLANNYIGKNIK